MSELCYTENMHSPSRDTPYSRKSNKPLMEKRRRSRINNCLNDLKALVLDALKKDSSRYSKLEKADILEMTVKHLRSVQRQQISAAITNDPTVIGKYRAGYNECANEVSRYLSAVEGMDADTRCRLLSHLAGCMPAEQKPQQQAPQPSQPLTQPIQVQIPNIPNVLSVSSNGSVQTPTLLTASPVQATQVAALPGANGGSDVTRFTGAIQVVPTRLPSGAIALIVPGQSFQQSPTTYQYVQGTSPVQISPSVAQTTFATVPVAIQPTVVNQMIVSPVPASEAPVSTVRTPSPQMFMTTTSPALSPVSPKQTIHVPTAQHARQENPWRPW